MDQNNLKDLYFKWMCSIAFPVEHVRSHYYNALNLLNSIDFTYLIDLDENRLIDGLDLRYHFSYGTKIPYNYVQEQLMDKNCSVLEMIMALAIRCEDSIMSNNNYGDRTSEWFWLMFSNLGLYKYTDDTWTLESYNKVESIIYTFLNRQYDEYGNGNLFKFNEPPSFDIRTIEIWDQMCLYMGKIVKNDSIT